MYSGLDLYLKRNFFVGGRQEDDKRKTAEALKVHNCFFKCLIFRLLDVSDWLEGSLAFSYWLLVTSLVRQLHVRIVRSR